MIISLAQLIWIIIIFSGKDNMICIKNKSEFAYGYLIYSIIHIIIYMIMYIVVYFWAKNKVESVIKDVIKDVSKEMNNPGFDNISIDTGSGFNNFNIKQGPNNTNNKKEFSNVSSIQGAIDNVMNDMMHKNGINPFTAHSTVHFNPQHKVGRNGIGNSSFVI